MMTTIVSNDQTPKVKNIIHLYNEVFSPSKCQLVARSPGRVNLIGEHIDYCGYSVLPMALQQDVMMAFSVFEEETGLTLRNKQDTYSIYESSSNTMHINKDKPEWFHYFFCGYKGIQDYALEKGIEFPQFGLKVLVDGTIPPSAGLSSSSAFVCCSAIVTMKAAGFDIPKKELAELCARCERYIGTEGGGMDQAISLLAEPGQARLIIFNQPLETKPVVLPSDAVFVVANSMQQMNKAASNQFNQRVVECRTAAKLLTKLLLPTVDWRTALRLKDVETQVGCSLEEMVTKVTQLLHPEVYTRTELCELLQVSDEEFDRLCLTDNTRQMDAFKLRQRAEHVFSEANRVLKFLAVCSSTESVDPLVDLGRLMHDSHSSCSHMYECSSPQLDALVQVCESSGSLGSRLTGAGWGGCTVSLVRRQHVTQFIHKLTVTFYASSGDISQALFESEPSGGACIYSTTN